MSTDWILKVQGIGKTFDTLGETVFSEMDRLRESDAKAFGVL